MSGKDSYTRTRAHTRAKAFRSVINPNTQIKHFTTCFDFLITCVLIKICVYSHVAIIQNVIIDYLIEVTLLSILISTAIDST